MGARTMLRVDTLLHNKGKVFVAILVLMVVGKASQWLYFTVNTNVQVEIYPSWTTHDPHDKEATRRVYVYSAFLSRNTSTPHQSHIHLTAFQDGCVSIQLTCCLKLGQSRENAIIENVSTVDFSRSSLKHPFLGISDNVPCAVVYTCRFPVSPEWPGSVYVTMTSTSCPLAEDLYLPVHNPKVKAGGLAVCAKAIYGQQLDPRELVQWFEMQRLLGVDKVQLFDLGNSEIVHRILRHYQDMGFLTVLPLFLPGRPWGRRVTPYDIDLEADFFPVLDCRLRLAGHDYVMGIDVDEVILPRKHRVLKPFIAEQFQKDPQAASLFFNAQFFVEEWGPVDRKAPLSMLQYLNSTVPHWECYKYIYMPTRVHQVTTHVVHSYPGYSRSVEALPCRTVQYNEGQQLTVGREQASVVPSLPHLPFSLPPDCENNDNDDNNNTIY